MDTANQNLLIHNGINLVEHGKFKGGPSDKTHPYDTRSCYDRLGDQIRGASATINDLPSAACPLDQGVLKLGLHSAYLAKSYFPDVLLATFNLESVGSKPFVLGGKPSVEIYCAGKRRSIDMLSAFLHQEMDLPNAERELAILEDLRKVEYIHAYGPGERLKGIPSRGSAMNVEIGIHSKQTDWNRYMRLAFEAFSEDVSQGSLHSTQAIHTGKLSFIYGLYTPAKLRRLEQFSFLRVVRPAPTMRLDPSCIDEFRIADELALPNGEVLDQTLRVAIFDGGFHQQSVLNRWTTTVEPDGIGGAVRRGLDHGTNVTSAYLFGSLSTGTEPPIPFCEVDHIRIVDDAPEDVVMMPQALKRIEDALVTGNYQFANISVAPCYPVDDDDIHPWTSKLDELLSNGDVLVTIAAGNGGMKAFPDSRIQVPADGVNVLSVGAATTDQEDWNRADYSSIGPGRHPGRIKPDVVAFGGSTDQGFIALNSHGYNATAGTSLAAPACLHLATGLKAHFGDDLTVPAIKALLIHKATNQHNIAREQVGWGRVPTDIQEVIVCPPGTATVAYQGKLAPSQVILASVPMPEEPVAGMVELTGTICYFTETDPQDISSYTRAGLDIVFHHHIEKFRKDKDKKPTKSHDSKTFFSKGNLFANEATLRNDAHRWETVIKHQGSFRGSSLKEPWFEIHYNPRFEGGSPRSNSPIHYALIVTVKCVKEPQLFDKILQKYPNLQQVRSRHRIRLEP